MSGTIWTEIEPMRWNEEGILYPYNFSNSFTPEAAHYYAPSIISAVLYDPGYFISFSTLLLPQINNRNKQWWDNYLKLFTIEQKNLIVELVFILDDHYSRLYDDWYSCTKENSDLGKIFDFWAVS